MKYYKDTNNKPYVFEDNVTAEIIIKIEATHSTTLTEVTLADHEALIAPTLEQIKAEKIISIDSTTAQAIVALVGDDNKQKAKLAEHTSLSRLEARGKATAAQIDRLDDLDDLNIKVMKLKASGNAREQKVNAIKLSDFKTLQDAIKAIEAL